MLLDTKHTVLFDLDGTLTDPEQGISRCIRFALEQMQLPVPDKSRLRDWIGPPLKASFADWFTSIGSDADAGQALELYRQRFADIGLFENTVYPGIERLLANLHRQGRQLLVATAKPTLYADRIIRHFKLDQYFVEVCGSELDGRNTNKVELLASIINKQKLGSEDCIMIGDRHYDIAAASYHRISSIGVLWGYGSHLELSRAGADCTVKNVAQLATTLGLVS